MVLIGHDAIEAYLISQGILLMVLVVQDMGLFWVEIPVREAQAPRDVAIRLLSEVIDLYFIFGPG
jgi:hypothetical protein